MNSLHPVTWKPIDASSRRSRRLTS